MPRINWWEKLFEPPSKEFGILALNVQAQIKRRIENKKKIIIEKKWGKIWLLAIWKEKWKQAPISQKSNCREREEEQCIFW